MSIRRSVARWAPTGVVDMLRRAEKALLPVRWRCAVLVSLPLTRVAPGAPRRLLIRAVHMIWGNPSYSASLALCIRLDELAGDATHVVESGSGLTSLLLRRRPGHLVVTTLEHDRAWADAMTRALPANPMAELRCVPLEEVAPGVAWYSLDDDVMSRADLVLCDGPPADTTPGGRRGVVDALRGGTGDRLVVVDDVDRTDEMSMLQEMVDRLDAKVLEIVRSSKSFAIVRLPAGAG